MNLHEMKYNAGARHTTKRLGRGQGSGQGKTAGKGHKGQNARSGGGVAIGFEGGQTPFYKSMPKRGFTNFNRLEFAVINLSDLNRFDEGTVITPEVLIDTGMIKKQLDGIKILGDGELTKKLTVKAHNFSRTAMEQIEKLGGKVEVI